MKDAILVWWMNQAVVSRPLRLTVQIVVEALGVAEFVGHERGMKMEQSTLKYRPDNTSYDVERLNYLESALEKINYSSDILVEADEALTSLGFKRKYFEDGWFYVPPAKLASATLPKAPVASAIDTRIVFTYFIQSVEGGPIKIGKSADVLRRLRQFQTGSPFRLRLLLAIPFDEAEEKDMHELFADLRIADDDEGCEAGGDEWFRPGKRLLAFIDEHILRLCAVGVKADYTKDVK